MFVCSGGEKERRVYMCVERKRDRGKGGSEGERESTVCECECLTYLR